jgi:hypothetical protein
LVQHFRKDHEIPGQVAKERGVKIMINDKTDSNNLKVPAPKEFKLTMLPLDCKSSHRLSMSNWKEGRVLKDDLSSHRLQSMRVPKPEPTKRKSILAEEISMLSKIYKESANSLSRPHHKPSKRRNTFGLSNNSPWGNVKANIKKEAEGFRDRLRRRSVMD